VNTKSSLVEQLRGKEYRDAFVASQIRIGLPMQCRALREGRALTQPQLAEAAGMSQPRISEIERPGERKLNIDTLLRLASAFDVALQVRFVPFSKFVDDEDSIDLDNFYVNPFDQDVAHISRIEEQMKSVIQMDQSSAFKAAQKAEGQIVKKSALQGATAGGKRNVLEEQKGQGETAYSESSIYRAS
jgi:transcriptional regulator with XRE-family HTH domain